MRAIGDQYRDFFKWIEAFYESKGELVGVPTGLSWLDRMTDGLQQSELSIIAARPGMGKSSLACSITRAVALRGLPVAFFSLELTERALLARLTAQEGSINLGRLLGGWMEDSDWPRLARAAAVISEAPIHLDTSNTLAVSELRQRVEFLHRERSLGLVVVDFVQLMRSESPRQTREEELSEIARGLKVLAKDLGIPILAVSSLNRVLEQRWDKRPLLSDLRGTGELEDIADLVVFIYRQEVYEPLPEHQGKAEIIIAKHRNGPIGTLLAAFKHAYVRFEDLKEEAAEVPA